MMDTLRGRYFAKAVLLGPVIMAFAAAGGCTVVRNEFRTLVSDPIKYEGTTDAICTKYRNKSMAKEHFDWFQDSTTDAPRTPEFRDGFIDGFVDYLTFGGNAAPPVMPPRRFWGLSDRTPAGHGAAHDWFAGFTAGAGEARRSGLRQQQLVPASFLLADEVVDHAIYSREQWGEPSSQSLEVLPSPEDMQPSPPGDLLQEATELPSPSSVGGEHHETPTTRESAMYGPLQ